MERICKRTIAFFLLLMLGMLVAVLSVFTVAAGPPLPRPPTQQRSYRLEVGTDARDDLRLQDAQLHRAADRIRGGDRAHH